MKKNKPKNILFRADSSSVIGTGHIMRDLVLARQYEDAHIIFAAQNLEGNINHRVEEAGYKVEVLNSSGIDEIIKLIKKHFIDMIVIDHYGIDYEYEKQLKTQNPELKIMVLDDTYERHYCDILLNHNIYANPLRYTGLVPKQCELRCGAKYTLIRDEFIKEKKNPKSSTLNPKSSTLNPQPSILNPQSSILNIFIAMGGTDHSNKNIEILKVLENFSNIHAHIVTTTANSRLSKLKAYIKDKRNITLYIDTNQIAKLMSGCDFAIVTPSVTLNEIFYMQLPFIAIQTADNQNEMTKYLIKNNYPVLTNFTKKALENCIKVMINRIS